MGLIRQNSRPPQNLHAFYAAVILLLAVATCATAVPNLAAGSDPDHYLWKSVPAAQCKLDDKIPLAWNVFQTDNKKQQHLVLILLGRRFLAMDLHAKQVYNVPLTDLKASGSNWESGDLFVESRILPTENWTLRDVGPAELIKLTLKDYNRFLQIELPHPTDLRGLY
jgi:hypothetical protein